VFRDARACEMVSSEWCTEDEDDDDEDEDEAADAIYRCSVASV
jgi:hypothetical protein